MGSPPMNLLHHAPGCDGQRVMGIRPEHLDLTPGSGWALHTDTVELLGAERLVHARLGDELLTLRLDASLPAPQPGATFHATARADRVHWFNAESGKRIETKADATAKANAE
jgi:sn-glycerol 3-phosphate transport system ATP-binding protein